MSSRFTSSAKPGADSRPGAGAGRGPGTGRFGRRAGGHHAATSAAPRASTTPSATSCSRSALSGGAAGGRRSSGPCDRPRCRAVFPFLKGSCSRRPGPRNRRMYESPRARGHGNSSLLTRRGRACAAKPALPTPCGRSDIDLRVDGRMCGLPVRNFSRSSGRSVMGRAYARTTSRRHWVVG